MISLDGKKEKKKWPKDKGIRTKCHVAHFMSYHIYH